MGLLGLAVCTDPVCVLTVVPPVADGVGCCGNMLVQVFTGRLAAGLAAGLATGLAAGFAADVAAGVPNKALTVLNKLSRSRVLRVGIAASICCTVIALGVVGVGVAAGVAAEIGRAHV